MIVKTDSATKQLVGWQDYARKSDNSIIIADGHGGNITIDVIRKSDILTFEKDPSKYINDLESNLSKLYTKNDGSTFSSCRVYCKDNEKNILEFYWIGDSTIKVFNSKKNCIFNNTYYKKNNFNQSVRKKIKKFNTCAKGDHDLGLKEVYYWKFEDNDTVLNMSECLGHNNIAYFGMNHYQIEINEPLFVVIGTDGFWDMIHDGDISRLFDLKFNAKALVDFAHTRWQQKWRYDPTHPGSPPVPKKKIRLKPKQWDDIAVGTLQLEP